MGTNETTGVTVNGGSPASQTPDVAVALRRLQGAQLRFQAEYEGVLDAAIEMHHDIDLGAFIEAVEGERGTVRGAARLVRRIIQAYRDEVGS